MGSGGEREKGALVGVVICVTGLSKERRKQVKDDTERMGGIYSPSLTPSCTHLIYSYSGSDGSYYSYKLEHAFNNSSNHHLFVVTLGWFLECVSHNSRVSELPYSLLNNPFNNNNNNVSFYIDGQVSPHLRDKVVDVVVQQGGVVVKQWYVGCGVDYVVSEASSLHHYLGRSLHIVSPIWVLKSFQNKHTSHRFVGLSPDLATDVSFILQNATLQQGTFEDNSDTSRLSKAERVQIVKVAKSGIRNRRTRRLQSCEIPLRPINPSSLLDSVCWSISEPTSTASIYVDPLLSSSDREIQKHMLLDGQERDLDVPFSNSVRSLTESERNEIVFRNHFLTVLYPVDRFAEMGPSSRTYFSDMGFTCQQLLDFIYDFYQENMSVHEIEAAIHTDSRHAEKLRSMYCSEKTEDRQIMYKRIELLGSRKSFELLKRVSGDNNSNVYELLIRE